LDQSFQLAQRWLLHDFMPSRIHANKTMVDNLLYSSPFATIRVIRGQNFRFTSIRPGGSAGVRTALRA
jgi:hypothetical protein